jgi:hypothetical protein
MAGVARLEVLMALNPSSPWLSERLISRLPPIRKHNLMWRLLDHARGAEHGCDARGNIVNEKGPTLHLSRTERVLGRLSALTA